MQNEIWLYGDGRTTCLVEEKATSDVLVEVWNQVPANLTPMTLLFLVTEPTKNVRLKRRNEDKMIPRLFPDWPCSLVVIHIITLPHTTILWTVSTSRFCSFLERESLFRPLLVLWSPILVLRSK